jgi:hypothetical protein
MPHGESTYDAADVCIEFHRSGTAFLTWIDVDWTDTVATINIARSKDGSQNWTDPIVVIRSDEVKIPKVRHL